MMLMNRLGVLEVCSSAKRENSNHLIFLCYYTKNLETGTGNETHREIEASGT